MDAAKLARLRTLVKAMNDLGDGTGVPLLPARATLQAATKQRPKLHAKPQEDADETKKTKKNRNQSAKRKLIKILDEAGENVKVEDEQEPSGNRPETAEAEEAKRIESAPHDEPQVPPTSGTG